MSSFCRITGKARDQPKPNFFPIIPPISPADARKLCKITGRRMDDHHFVPLLEFGKRPECVRCKITGTGDVKKEMPAENGDGEQVHIPRDDYKYVAPILRKDVIEKEYQKSFEDLQKLLKRLKKGSDDEKDQKYFVYLLPTVLCGIIVPIEVEEAIRLGEIESLSISKNCDKAIFKIKGRPTMFIPLKESDIKKSEGKNLYNGKGQSKETLNRQKKVLEEKKKKMFASRKIFQDLEKAADEELLNDQDRPKGKARIFGGISKEAKQYRQKLADFREMYTPAGNMALYGDWKKSLKVILENLDWDKIGNVKSVEIEGSLPKQAKLSPADDNQLSERKRIKNIYDPGMLGLEVVPAVEEVNLTSCEIPKELIDFINCSKQQKSECSSSLKTMFKDEDTLRILSTIDEFQKAVKKMDSSIFAFSNVKSGFIYDDGDGAKFSEEKSSIPPGSKVISGVIVRLDEASVFIPGEEVKIDGENKFVPGQRMSSVNGEFIPGASIRTKENEFKFLPGYGFNNEAGFNLGQFVENENGGVHFTKGQVIRTNRGPLFIEGQTVATADGLKFVAGLTIETEIGPAFVCGGLVDMGEESKFVPGQMMGGTEKDPLVFIPGQMGEIMEKQVFVPGQTVTTPDEKKVFIHGQMVDTADGPMYLYGDVMVNNKNQVQFMPGQLIFNEERDKDEFIPGMITESAQGAEFMEGRLVKKGDDALFVPGKTTVFIDGVGNRFDKASDKKNIALQKCPSNPMLVDCNNMSMIFKKYRASPGVMVKTKNGSKFYPDGKVPDDIEGAEVIEGRMEYNKDGPHFVPGKVMEINGVKTFIPGKIVVDDSGEEVFVPGKMIETKNGPKFVPGQVIETAEGEKFIPGQVMDTPTGTKFVPGQMIDTKSGSVFIPGQVIQTDNGMKFVPGQIVETESGAVFVPGQVIDSPDGCKFVPGQVIDTPEGPRLLPPDIKGDGDIEFCVQGFDINQEEMQLLLGSSTEPVNFSDILSGAGGSNVAGEALKALAMGFKAQKSKDVIPIVGETEEEKDIDKILEDEMLDCYDSPSVRKIIKAVFIATFAEICDNIDEVMKMMDDYMCGNLDENLEKTVMSKMKLNPAIESMKKLFQEKNPNDPEEFDIMNLISGIISCSIPGALKECCDNAEDVEERKLKAILLDCIEDSIRNILQEEGVVPKGLIEDIKELIQLAKDLEFEGNQSFFSKVAAVSEGRCNSKFMNTLLTNFKEKAGLPNFGFDMSELLKKLIQILAPRIHLQQGFHIMSMNMPDLVKEVLNTLKGDIRDIEGYSAIDVLHHAICKVMNRYCQDEINDVMHMFEVDPDCLEKDQGLAAMIEQAVGLATYMRQTDTAAALAQLLSDPERLKAIKHDPVVLDVLRKLLCMRKLAERDPEKRDKIAKLQRFGSGDRNDMLLKELWEMSDILTKPPIDIKASKKLKKSKSMIKQSKSMIMSAKDIPMNAFLAMKTTSDDKDESWLKNFLSESVVDDIPWECSKALIILKEGFQAIIPREASRSILLGEASYTLIDDNGIEFFLSPMDKRKRRLEGKEDDPSVRRQKEPEPPSFNKPRRPAPMANAIIEEDEEDEDLPKPSAKPSKKDTLMDDADLSLFTKKKPVFDSDDEDDFGFERPKPGNKFESSFAKQSEEDVMDMEKYRPHNYETTRPKGDDINDLMDYYSNFKTNRNAMGRLGNANRQVRNHEDEFDDVATTNDGFDKEMNWRKKYSDPEQNYVADYEPPPPRKKYSEPEDIGIERPYERTKFDYGDSIDPATRLILMKNNTSSTPRARMTFDDDEPPSNGYRPPPRPAQNRSYGSNYEGAMDMLRPSPPKQRESNTDTALSSKTRMMLDKLKQSTQELQGLTDESEDVCNFVPAKKAEIRRKKSRFLRTMSGEDDIIDEEPDKNRYASSLANDILGLRNDSMGDYDKYRPEPIRQSPPKRPGKGRTYDFDDEPAAPTYKFVDEDDTDAMIQNLKQKTTRRAATDILRDIERDVTPVKFEPVASFRDTFRASPEPENNRYGSLNRKPNKQTRKPAAYDTSQDVQNPFSSLRKPEPPSDSPYARFAPKKPAGYDDDDDDGMLYGGGRGGGGGSYGGTQNYGSLGRNAGGLSQQQQQQPKQQQQYMQQQQQQPAYGQSDPYGGPGQDLYGMQGGYGQQSYGQQQMQQMQQPYGQGYGGMSGYGQQQQQPDYGQGGYGQMGQSMGGGMGGMGGMGGGMGGYGQPQQAPNLRQARHQRFGNANGYQ